MLGNSSQLFLSKGIKQRRGGGKIIEEVIGSWKIITFTRWFKIEAAFPYSGIQIFFFNNTSWLRSLVHFRCDRPHCNCERLKRLAWSLMDLGLVWALTRSTSKPRKTNTKTSLNVSLSKWVSPPGEQGIFFRDPAAPVRTTFGVRDPQDFRLYNAILLPTERLFLGKC